MALVFLDMDFEEIAEYGKCGDSLMDADIFHYDAIKLVWNACDLLVSFM